MDMYRAVHLSLERCVNFDICAYQFVLFASYLVGFCELELATSYDFGGENG
jgi:hypothetical protein